LTGSKEVGLNISKLAATPVPGQIWIKRVVAEMGGKDSNVVDSKSDLDTAVERTAVSAFKYQGQECSACSRPIWRKASTMNLWKTGSRVSKNQGRRPRRSNQDVGPVINAKAKATFLYYIEIGKREGGLITGRKTTPLPDTSLSHRVRGGAYAGAHFPGRDFRSRAGGFEGAKFPGSAANCQQY
jgi:1-pyrroline-5-carboxylate dehydrogenase